MSQQTLITTDTHEIPFVPVMRERRLSVARGTRVRPSAVETGERGAARTREECERLLINQLSLIDRIAAVSARRHRLGSEDAEDFGAVVRMTLVENDYAVLRKFEGRSTLKTYLTVVIQRLLLDYCRSRWGKWRPSQAARQAGTLALLFERLTTRDGLSFVEALATVEASHTGQLTAATLESLAGRARRQLRRRFVDVEALANVAAPDVHHNESVLCGESRTITARLMRALAAGFGKLEPEDREILRLRFGRGWSVANIARALGTDQKALYRRIERLLAAVRTELERAGVSRDDVQHS